MNMTQTIKAMSDHAKVALEATSSHLIGTVVPVTYEAREDLRALELIGDNDGLTIKGSAIAERLQREHEDRIFG